MTDNETTREKTFSEELPYFKERIKEVFDNYHNPNGYEDPLYIAVRKAEEEITRQQTEIEQWKEEANKYQNLWCMAVDDLEKAKSEAVKEFAERLKHSFFDNGYESPDVDFDYFVDNLIKEMTEVNENEMPNMWK